MIVHNPRFNPPTWAGTGWYWAHPAFDLYWPMTTTLWAGLARVGWVDAPDQFGGHLNPAVFHLAGVTLHTLATVILFTILRRLFRDDLAAMAGALLFGLHPIQTEAVVFAGVLDNPLAAFFSLLAVAQYVAVTDPAGQMSRRVRSVRWVVGSGALILATLSKPSAVVVPPMAMALDWAFHKRPMRQVVLSILPWALLVLPCVVWTATIQRGHDAFHSPIAFRPQLAADAVTFYVHKILWPVPLAIDYGRSPQFVLSHGMGWMAMWVPAVLLAVAIFVRRRYPIVCASIAIFLISLLPNSGLLPFDYQMFSTVADRYVYLSMIGVALAVAALVHHYPIIKYPLVVALIALVVQTELQITTWRNGETLFRHALMVNPRSWMSEGNLAVAIGDRVPDEAIALCHQSIELRPDDPNVWNTLGSILMARGRRVEAIDAFRQAHQLEPGSALDSSNYARALQMNPG